MFISVSPKYFVGQKRQSNDLGIYPYYVFLHNRSSHNIFLLFFLLNTLLPLSLIFSFELVKLIQTALVFYDVDIYDAERDLHSRVSNSQLMEELG